MGPTWVLSAPEGPMLAPWTLLSEDRLKWLYLNKDTLRDSKIPFQLTVWRQCGYIVWSGPCGFPNSKVHEAIMRPIWGRQDPGGPHVGPMNFAIWVILPCPFYTSDTFYHMVIQTIHPGFSLRRYRFRIPTKTRMDCLLLVIVISGAC